ncbi:hypothetical protein V6N13_149448 [Hibiscus sabdariffa]
MQIVSSGRQESKEDHALSLVQARFCDLSWMSCGGSSCVLQLKFDHFWSRVSVPMWWYRYRFLTGIWCTGIALLVPVRIILGTDTRVTVPVRVDTGIGTVLLESLVYEFLCFGSWTSIAYKSLSVLRLDRVEGVTSVGIRARLRDNRDDLGCGMARLRGGGRRGGRRGGRAPVLLDEIGMEPVNEEPLPPPPPGGGEANEGGAGP